MENARIKITYQPVGHTTKLQSLLTGLAIGDADARNEIIEHACERLRMLTHRMLREYTKVKRWEQTDDVHQNAMLRLHRSLVQVKPEWKRDGGRAVADLLVG